MAPKNIHTKILVPVGFDYFAKCDGSKKNLVPVGNSEVAAEYKVCL